MKDDLVKIKIGKQISHNKWVGYTQAYINCPICESGTITYIYHGDTDKSIEIFNCTKCDYANKIPRQELETWVYNFCCEFCDCIMNEELYIPIHISKHDENCRYRLIATGE